MLTVTSQIKGLATSSKLLILLLIFLVTRPETCFGLAPSFLADLQLPHIGSATFHRHLNFHLIAEQRGSRNNVWCSQPLYLGPRPNPRRFPQQQRRYQWRFWIPGSAEQQQSGITTGAVV